MSLDRAFAVLALEADAQVLTAGAGGMALLGTVLCSPCWCRFGV